MNDHADHFDPAPSREREFVDTLSIILEEAGFPPVTGRILGRLLVCEPRHQSSVKLADYVRASAGAVSTSTRMLLTIGFIEKIRFPGDRASYFRIKPDCWNEILHLEVLRYARLRKVAELGVRLMQETGDPQRASRVREFHDFASFFEAELPMLLERWDQRKESPS